MEYKIYKTPETHDSDDVRFIVDGKEKGFGYRGKNDTVIHIVRCPTCDNENYMHQPICIQCGFTVLATPPPTEEKGL